MTDTTHEAFFGDATHAFRLTHQMVLELERTAGAGIGTLFNRVIHQGFGLADITETIRLGLIGAGTSPERAASLVATYVHGRPLNETYPLAVSILEACWFGKTEAPNGQA